MNKDQPSGAASSGPSEALAEAESSLGQALAIIHRILPRLDEPGRGSEVQVALQRAAGCVESARQAHQRASGSVGSPTGSLVQTSLAADTVAVISAAISAILDRPYRMVSLQHVAAPVPHLNVWALEGRTQIFQSHKIR